MTSFNRDAYGTSEVWSVILARNEAPTIRAAVMGALPYAHRVLVMDGRSSDGTAEVARDAGAVVYTDEGRGKGAAIRQSITLASCDVLVFMDADGSHDPADIPRLALPVTEGNVDLCIGSRFAGGSEELSVSLGQLIRTIGNISMNVAINTRWRTLLTDTLNGFRAVRRSAVVQSGLREDRHTIEQEMVMKMLRHGYRVCNVATHEYARRFGQSHINIAREWPLFVWCVIANIARRDLPPHQRPQLEPCAGAPMPEPPGA